MSAELELARLRAAIAVKGGTEHAPTEWAYVKACDTIRSRDARIAALTEALQRQNTAAEGLLAAEARKAPIGFYLSKLGIEVLNARAALTTTDKEPTI